MNCKDIDKLLTAYLEGAATPEEQEQVQTHLSTCFRCRDELEVRRTSRDQLGHVLRITASHVTSPVDAWELIAKQASLKHEVEKPSPKKSGMAWMAIPLSIFLLVVLVGGFLSGLGGMTPPPPKAPAVVIDGTGGAFIFWQDTPDNYSSGVYGQHVDAGGTLLWGEENKQLGEVSVPLAVSDGSGGAIIASADDNSIYVQRLNAQGNVVWDSEKVPVWFKPVGGWHSLVGIVSDGSGGAILLRDTSDDKVYAQRINADGTLLWGDGGVLLGSIKAAYRGMPIVSDGSGGTVFIWEDSSGEGIQIYAQRISYDGELVWAKDGVSVTSVISEKERPKLINDGTGGFIIAWANISIDNMWDENIYVQKLDADGRPMWGDTGVLVYDDPERQSAPQLTADGSGGCFIVWRDIRISTSSSRIFAQRISSDGEPLWQNGGVPLWDISEDWPRTSVGDIIYVTGDGIGNSIVIWTSSREPDNFQSGMQVYMQKLNANGQRLWQDAAIKVFETPPFRAIGYSSIINDGSGGFIISSRVSEDAYVSNSDSVYAQRVDSEGNRRWGEDGMEIQMKHSSPILPIIAVVVILITALVLFGVSRNNRLARIFTAIAPVLIGIVALFTFFLLIGPLSYSYEWAYILKTPINLVAVAIVPIAGLAIGIVSIWKRTITRWIIIPVVVFITLITVIIEFIVFAGYFQV